jgi:hypothetical protein
VAADVPPADEGQPGPIEAALLAELEAAGRAAGVEGLVALSVARDLDRGTIPAGQRASVGERLGKLKAAALVGVRAAREPDRLDEITARRLAKAAAAS